MARKYFKWVPDDVWAIIYIIKSVFDWITRGLGLGMAAQAEMPQLDISSHISPKFLIISVVINFVLYGLAKIHKTDSLE